MSKTALEKAQAMPMRQVQNVPQLLVNAEVRTRLREIATKALGPDRIIRLFAESARQTPKLLQCEPMSVFNALIQCANTGLEPNTWRGHAYLIPYGKVCTFIAGYKGMIDMARRHPDVLTIHADVAYDDDEAWSFEYGSNTHLRHIPGPHKGKITHAYCYVKLRDGAEAFRVLTYDEIIAHRDQYSQGWKTAVKFKKTAESPWVKDEAAMCKKTAVRAIANGGLLPMSNEFLLALANDEGEAEQAAADDPMDAIIAGLEDGGATIDGEAHEVDGDDDAPEAAKKPEQKPVKVKTGKAKREAKADNAPSMRDAIQWQNIYNTMAADLLDAASKNDFIETYGEQLDGMKIEAPELFDQISAEINDAFNADGQGAMDV